VSFGHAPNGQLDASRRDGHALGVQLVGVNVHLRDVETFDDIADVTAPAPVEPGDVVATVDENGSHDGSHDE
jgi:hypothetical protein